MLRGLIHSGLVTLALAGAVLLGGCPGTRGEAAGKGAPAAAATAAPARPAVAVEVAPVRAAEVEEALEVVGSLKPKFEATVRSEYTGTLAEVYITEWVTVKKGDPMARLDTRDAEARVAQAEAEVAQAKADLLRAEAGAERARRQFDRIAQLKTEEIVSEQNLDDARQQRDTAAADVQASRARLMVAQEGLRQARLKVTKSVLRAPMDGMVAMRKANVGQFVDNMGQGDPLFRIVDNALLDLTLTVPSTELGRVRIGQPVGFTTDFLPGKTFEARVTHINPAADPATRAVSVVAEVKNESGELRDGLFVKGRIVTGRREGVLQVPRAALLPGSSGEGQAELFVVEQGTARKRRIRLGGESAQFVEAAEGLRADEPVVTRGAFMLREGDPVKAVEPAAVADAADAAKGA